MSEQTDLTVQLDLLRSLLDSPTLPVEAQRAARRIAQDLGDRCWLNIGWHASKSRGELTGEASTETLLDEMDRLIWQLRSLAKKPKRPAHRPEKKATFAEALLILPEYEHAKKKLGSNRKAANFLITKGLVGNPKSTTIDAVVKKLELLSKKSRRVGR
jgi:hypothetical protein